MLNHTELIEKLKANKITHIEYQRFKNECKKLTAKACYVDGLGKMQLKPHLKESLIENIATDALLRSIATFDSRKGKFSSYYFNKARSLARVERRKIVLRYNIYNAYSLDELQERKENHEKNH